MSSNTHLSPPTSSATPSRPSLLRSLSSTSSIPTSLKRDKPRLYLALYARGTAIGSSSSSNSYSTQLTCPSYHWTFLVGPKSASRADPGTCLQISHAGDRGWFEEVDLSQQTPVQSKSLLLRITLAKVRDEAGVKALLRTLSSKHTTSCSCCSGSTASSCASLTSTTSTDDTSTHDRDRDRDQDTCPNHNCLSWVRMAFRTLFSPSSDPSRLLKSYLTPQSWPELEECARKYAKKKRNQGRFHNLGMGMNRGPGAGDGLGDYRGWNDDDVPTWNFWERRETTS